MFEFNQYNTSNYIQIHNTCRLAATQKRLSIILGYPGSGKSFSVNHIANNNNGIYKISLGGSVSPKEMYSRILNVLRDTDINHKHTSVELLRRIKSTLELKTGNQLIFIDEGGKFEKGNVQYFHELRDLTEKHCGIVIAAPKYFKTEILDWMDKGIKGVEEFYSRINGFVELDRPSNQEIKGLFKINNLDKTKEQKEFLESILKTPKKERSWRRIKNLTILNFDDELLIKRSKKTMV